MAHFLFCNYISTAWTRLIQLWRLRFLVQTASGFLIQAPCSIYQCQVWNWYLIRFPIFIQTENHSSYLPHGRVMTRLLLGVICICVYNDVKDSTTKIFGYGIYSHTQKQEYETKTARADNMIMCVVRKIYKLRRLSWDKSRLTIWLSNKS